MAFSSDNIAIFLAVLDHGSFSAAARALGRVPSAVSMAIANLEAELDLQLFDRTSREVRPTESARALEAEARQMAGQLRRLQAHALSLHQGLERRLTLAIAPELLSAPWSDPLARLAEEFPSLEVDVLSAPQNDALRMLHDGSAQLALIYERPQIDQRESFQELGSEVLVAVISPRHPQARERNGRFRLEDLIDMRQIAIVSRDARIEDERVLISRKLWRTDSHLATLSLVRAGVGWAYLPHRLAAPLLDAGELLGIGFAHMSNQVRLWVDVVWLNDRPLGLGAQRLIALMKDIAGLEARPT
ncbi:LysR family transcriptional regulator [Duganella violaceipulchra]|uniref:DNA-binding transcriptional LysR family regulator n=1 Tax=Duganella violaceipulchra TaxID=2849652 RepID=A0AA41L4U5_9BURK|nr:LysR family transcriptional regulator [Duganella violaceicalia]MBV6321417.1 LysR family transcriptional regulator [Duganella violaceicalia]MCP2009334.1 DNA-binding transcriptional LysR family regulator [Duganella violaceicalia]